jgi:protein-disulfide isomerase
MTDASEQPPRAPAASPARSIGTKGAVLAGLGGLLVGGGAVALWAGSGPGASRAEVEQIVREYVLENPEIIPEAMQRLQDNEGAKVVRANRAAIETPFAGAWAGAADGDVVLVEFFDYACGYCRKSNEDIDRLLKEDPKLKVVWRDWPVLGPESELAARASLAAARQGRFRQYYDRLFAAGRPNERTIAEAQQAAGVSPQMVEQVAASPEGKSELVKNSELARALGASGTPTFIVGDKVLQGAVGYEALKEAIEQARAKA